MIVVFSDMIWYLCIVFIYVIGSVGNSSSNIMGDFNSVFVDGVCWTLAGWTGSGCAIGLGYILANCIGAADGRLMSKHSLITCFFRCVTWFEPKCPIWYWRCGNDSDVE